MEPEPLNKHKLNNYTKDAAFFNEYVLCVHTLGVNTIGICHSKSSKLRGRYEREKPVCSRVLPHTFLHFDLEALCKLLTPLNVDV